MPARVRLTPRSAAWAAAPTLPAPPATSSSKTSSSCSKRWASTPASTLTGWSKSASSFTAHCPTSSSTAPSPKPASPRISPPPRSHRRRSNPAALLECRDGGGRISGKNRSRELCPRNRSRGEYLSDPTLRGYRSGDHLHVYGVHKRRCPKPSNRCLSDLDMDFIVSLLASDR